MAKAKSKPEHRSAAIKKGNICQTRQIKVTKTCYLYKLKGDNSGAGRPIPWIQLKGHWLQNAGFTIDTPVKVRVMDGCIVLTTE